ncbi:MAG: glycosyltransferase family 4 protein [Gemmatimonadota bacterium]
MRVLFVTQYGPLAASSRTRVFQYLPYLRASGVDVRVLTVLPDRGLAGSQVLVTRNPLRKAAYYGWAARRTLACGLRTWWGARRADVLFVQKVIFPAPVRWLLRWQGRPLLYDFDDAIFTTEVRQAHWLAAWKERRNARGLPAMLRLAAAAVVENDYTGRFAARYCRVCTITGPIDTAPFDAAPVRAPGPEVVLGWIGSGTTVAYLDLVRGPLERLAARHSGVRLRIVGAQWAAPPGLAVECKAWQLEEEAADLGGFDIGLMPIADDPWTRGKGGYKLLQYMAAGLPVVASPVGINQQIVTDGVTGFWARDDGEWEARLGQLIADPDLRRAMGRRGREAAQRTYSLEAQQGRLLDLLREAGGGG